MKIAILTPDYTVVPKVPDAKMLKAGLAFQHKNLNTQAVYSNMIAAAPSPVVTLDIYWAKRGDEYVLRMGRGYLASIRPTLLGFDLIVVDAKGPQPMIRDLAIAMRAAESALGLPVIEVGK